MPPSKDADTAQEFGALEPDESVLESSRVVPITPDEFSQTHKEIAEAGASLNEGFNPFVSYIHGNPELKGKDQFGNDNGLARLTADDYLEDNRFQGQIDPDKKLTTPKSILARTELREYLEKAKTGEHLDRSDVNKVAELIAKTWEGGGLDQRTKEELREHIRESKGVLGSTISGISSLDEQVLEIFLDMDESNLDVFVLTMNNMLTDSSNLDGLASFLTSTANSPHDIMFDSRNAAALRVFEGLSNADPSYRDAILKLDPTLEDRILMHVNVEEQAIDTYKERFGDRDSWIASRNDESLLRSPLNEKTLLLRSSIEAVEKVLAAIDENEGSLSGIDDDQSKTLFNETNKILTILANVRPEAINPLAIKYGEMFPEIDGLNAGLRELLTREKDDGKWFTVAELQSAHGDSKYLIRDPQARAFLSEFTGVTQPDLAVRPASQDLMNNFAELRETYSEIQDNSSSWSIGGFFSSAEADLQTFSSSFYTKIEGIPDGQVFEFRDAYNKQAEQNNLPTLEQSIAEVLKIYEETKDVEGADAPTILEPEEAAFLQEVAVRLNY